jgi:cytidine deaminase
LNVQRLTHSGPYSKFQVGCALLLHDISGHEAASKISGPTIKGANIENCSYPVGTCAERVAVGTAICHYGLSGSHIKAVAVATNVKEESSPCGMCRQFLREFLSLDSPIIMFGNGDTWSVKTMDEVSVTI